MHYEITASTQAVRKEMTTAQRKSSLFAEAPRVGATTLRRGQVLKLSPEQFAHRELSLKRLFLAHAIEVFKVDGKDRVSMRDQMERRFTETDVKKAGEITEADAAAKKAEADAAAKDAELLKMLSEAPVVPGHEAPVPKAEEPAVEAASAVEPVAHEEAPSVVEAAPAETAPVAESHGKKGKKGSK